MSVVADKKSWTRFVSKSGQCNECTFHLHTLLSVCNNRLIDVKRCTLHDFHQQNMVDQKKRIRPVEQSIIWWD